MQISVVLKVLEQMLATYSFFNLGLNAMKEIEPYMTSLFGKLAKLKMQVEVQHILVVSMHSC